MKKWLLFFAFLNLILLSGCQAMQSASFAKNPTPIETTAPSSPTPEETRSEKYPPGQYLVGIDIPAGEYKLICEEEDWPGYYCVSTTALAKTGEIIANDIFYNMSYVFVEEGQYLKLERCYTEDSLRLVERPPQETEMIPSDSVTEINAISDPPPLPHLPYLHLTRTLWPTRFLMKKRRKNLTTPLKPEKRGNSSYVWPKTISRVIAGGEGPPLPAYGKKYM